MQQRWPCLAMYRRTLERQYSEFTFNKQYVKVLLLEEWPDILWWQINFIYYHFEGPSVWHEHYPDCSGSNQSPIDIDRSTVKFSSSLISFEVPGYETIPRGAHWQLRNNGRAGKHPFAKLWFSIVMPLCTSYEFYGCNCCCSYLFMCYKICIPFTLHSWLA